MSFEFSNEFDKELEVLEFGEVGQSRISDGSGYEDYQNSIMVYNENFGNAIDTTLEWVEDVSGLATKSQADGVVVLTCTAAAADYIEEKNNGFVVNANNRTKKVKVVFRAKYSGNSDSYFGLQSAGNFKLLFVKQTGVNTSWKGYIMDDATNEYETAVFSVTKDSWHEFKLIYNYDRTDFYIDDVKVGSLIGNISTTDCSLVMRCQDDETALSFDWIRVWEIDIPK